MTFKAKLTVILKADDIVVAESDDTTLWQNTLLAINSEGTPVQQNHQGAPNPLTINPEPDKNDPVVAFSNEVGIEKDIIIGSCSPTKEKPFIHLDKHHWEALKKNHPKIAPTVVGGTILALWKEKANLGDVLQKDISAVLKTIALTGKNPKRAIDNCEWLQLRNDKLQINPAQASKAINLVKAYCQKVKMDS